MKILARVSCSLRESPENRNEINYCVCREKTIENFRLDSRLIAAQSAAQLAAKHGVEITPAEREIAPK